MFLVQGCCGEAVTQLHNAGKTWAETELHKGGDGHDHSLVDMVRRGSRQAFAEVANDDGQ